MRHSALFSGIAVTAAVLAGSSLAWTANAADPTPEPTPSASATATPSPSTSTSPTPTPTSTIGAEVNVVTINGTGCPVTSGTVKISEGSTLVVEYSDFLATKGPDIAAGLARRNCQMMLDVVPPEGTRFAVSSLSLEGKADLPAGVTASVTTTTYFQGNPSTPLLQDKIVGPHSGGWKLTQDVSIVNQVFSQCQSDALLAINNAVSLTGSTGTATATVSLERFSALTLNFLKC